MKKVIITLTILLILLGGLVFFQQLTHPETIEVIHLYPERITAQDYDYTTKIIDGVEYYYTPIENIKDGDKKRL